MKPVYLVLSLLIGGCVATTPLSDTPVTDRFLENTHGFTWPDGDKVVVRYRTQTFDVGKLAVCGTWDADRRQDEVAEALRSTSVYVGGKRVASAGFLKRGDMAGCVLTEYPGSLSLQVALLGR